MSNRGPAPTASRRPRSTNLTALVIAGAALIGVLGYQSLAPSSSSATSPVAAPPLPHLPDDALPAGDQGALGEADGVVPAGVTVLDSEFPAVAKLDADLLRALRQAAAEAARAGVIVYVDSGWRSPAYQEQLLRAAVSKYGSRQEAARWVATPTTSAHVSGDAVDIGPSNAAAWVSKHGAVYGLCQIYRNEPWHFELRFKAIDHGCPPMYADPTQDPRMQQ